MTERVFLGLGSNLADRMENLVLALLALARDPGIEVSACSRPFLTEPVSEIPQPTFLNAVAEIRTSYDPRSLLSRTRAIESGLGRRPGARWGPRTLDLDILLFGDRVVREPDLVVPHPRLHERAFVLFPLSELAPAYVHPAAGQTIAELKQQLPAEGRPPRPVEWGRLPRWSSVSIATL